MLEKNFKAKVKDRLKDWQFIELTAGAGIPKGFPDTLALSPNGYHCFIEWKKYKSAKRQPLQDYWNSQLNNHQHDSYIIYPENVEQQLKVIKNNDNEHLIQFAGRVP